MKKPNPRGVSFEGSCGRGDLNPHARWALPPEDSASTDSATSAHIRAISRRGSERTVVLSESLRRVNAERCAVRVLFQQERERDAVQRDTQLPDPDPDPLALLRASMDAEHALSSPPISWPQAPDPLGALSQAIASEAVVLGERREPLFVPYAPAALVPGATPRPATEQRSAQGMDRASELLLQALATQALPGQARAVAARLLTEALQTEDEALVRRALEVVVTGS